MGTPAAHAAQDGPQPSGETAGPSAQPAPGGLASFFTPVAPARGDGATGGQDLGSTESLPRSSGNADSGPGAGAGKPGGKTAAGAGGEGPVSALVRAIAARLARTGTTIKRQHTVTETRVSGTQTTSSSKNEQLAKHDQQHKTNRDAKLADLNNKASQARSNRDVKKADTSDAKTSDTKARKDDTSAKTGRDAKTSDTSARKDERSSKHTSDDKDHNTRSSKTGDSKGPGAPSGATVKDKPATPAGKDQAVGTGDRKTLKPETPATGDTAKPTAKDSPKTDSEAAPAGGRLRTQSSREAGWRDGARAAAVAGHVKAWHKGTRDGWEDRTAADTLEKQRMNAARDRNTNRPAGPEMAPTSGSTDALTKPTLGPAAGQRTAVRTPAVAAQVDEIGATHIRFTADNAAHTVSRAEVRTLRGFERRLEAKKPNLQRIAEAAKTAAAEAAEDANRAQQLADGARNVKGGDALVRTASRLAEHAHALRAAAEEVQKRASRSNEALDAVIANANTRHGAIYQAVVDSPLTAPAERYFYEDKQGD